MYKDGYFLVTVKSNVVVRLDFSLDRWVLIGILRKSLAILNKGGLDIDKKSDRYYIPSLDMCLRIQPYTPELMKGRIFSPDCVGNLDRLSYEDRTRANHYIRHIGDGKMANSLVFISKIIDAVKEEERGN